MAIVPAPYLNQPGFDLGMPMDAATLLPLPEVEEEEPGEYIAQNIPVPAPEDPQLAQLFALMEGGGNDMDLLTAEEEAQLNELLPPDPESEFDANLATAMDEGELDQIAKDVIDRFDDDEESRADWYEREAEGIRLLGVSSNVEGGADFDGASEVVHPMLMEAVLQFQARALNELWPPQGPAKTIVLGTVTPEREQQAKRVQDYINYAYTFKMKDAFNVTDKLLFRLPLSGSCFTKLYFCPLRQQVVRKLIKPGDFVVPYHCDDLDEASRYTHVLRMTHLEVKKLMANGFYRNLDLREPSDEDELTDTTLRDEIDAADSRDSSAADDEDQRHVILEQVCYLNLPGFDDPEGLDSPYIVHVEKDQQKVLAIYRNWKESDPLKEPRRYVTHYQFLPGLGFYGYGLYHIMSGLARSSTGALRALLDAAQFANLPGGFRSRDARVKGKDIVVSPGEWREVEATSEELAKTFFPLPYKEPSPVLFNLLGLMDELGRRLGGATEVLVGDAKTNSPVGSVLSLIEQSLKVMSGIHMRLHRSQAQELQLFAELNREFLPSEGYAYAIPGQDQWIMADDFDERVDVIPVSDPNVFSSTQRIAQAQAILDLSTQQPQIYDVMAVHRNMLQAMRIQTPEMFLPPQKEIPRADPVAENQSLLTGNPVKAYKDQLHDAHLQVHFDLLMRIPTLDSVGAKGSTRRTQIESAVLDHAAEHLGLKMRVQYEQALMQQGIMLPDQEVPPEIEQQISAAAAQAAQSLSPQPGPDPAIIEAEKKALIAEQQAQADARRKDQIAASEIERRNATTAAEISRRAADQEAKLLQQFISENAKRALEAQAASRKRPPVV